MRTILVAVNFSEASYNAANYAAHLCKFFHAKLMVLHAYHVPAVNPEGHGLHVIEKLKEEIDQKLDALCHELRSKFKTIHVNQITSFGFAAEVIEEQAKENNACLIVMGISSKPDLLTKYVFGSVSTRVSKTSSIPVLIIPEHISYKRVKKMAFACDLNKALGTDTLLTKVKQVHNLFRSGLQLLSVVKPWDLLTKQKIRTANRIEHKLNISDRNILYIYDKNVGAGLQEYIDHHDVDVMIMCPEKRNFFKELLMGSNSENIGYHFNIPVLTVNY